MLTHGLATAADREGFDMSHAGHAAPAPGPTLTPGDWVTVTSVPLLNFGGT